jgi:cobalt/nickel transport system ATP-binding protein
MGIVAVEGLRHAWAGGDVALDGVDLVVERGERVALLGRNGAGKTTLVLHLLGLLTPSAGRVLVGGVPYTSDNARELRRGIGLVFQDADDQLFMPTVLEDVAFGPANLGLSGEMLRERAMAALASVGADALADKAPHHLSGGERRRVAIAGVLALEPDLLVLDEPTAGLDPAGRRELEGLVASLPQALLLVTHDLGFAGRLCTRAVVLDHGRVVADAPVDEVLADEGFLVANGLA